MNRISQDKISKKQVWAGRVFTGLVTAALVGSASPKLPAHGRWLTDSCARRSARFPLRQASALKT